MARRRMRMERTAAGGLALADLRERPAPPFPWLRALLISLLALGGLAFAVVGLIRALIDTEAMKADAEAALRQATGREVRILGPLTITSYLGATVAVDDIQIPNRPGAAAPMMARIARLEAELSLGSLFGGAVEIQRLIVVQPEILVEIDAQGRGNWQNDAPAAPVAPGRGTFRNWPRNLHVKDGRLQLTDARAGRGIDLALRRISAAEVDTGGQLGLSADLALGSQRIAMSGQVGSLARLLDRAGTSAWPVRLTLDTLGARLAVAGAFARPLDLDGYALRVDATVADSSALVPLLPMRLPAMRTVVASARIASRDGALPEVSALRVQMGASDFGLWVGGLKADAMDIAVPSLAEAARGEFLGTLHGVPVRVKAVVGGLGAFLPGAQASAPFPLDIAAELGESRVMLKGSIAEPAARRGLDAALTLRVRALDMLAPIVGRRLPPLRDLSLDARIGDGAQGGFLGGLVLRDIAFSVPQGDLAGALDLRFGPRPAIAGRLRGNRFDADAAEPVVAALVGPLTPFEPQSLLKPQTWTDPKLIPDRKLDLAALEAVDLDLGFDIDEFRLAGMPYRDFSATLRVAEGRLLLDPVTASLPAGQAMLRLAADGRDARHPVALRLLVPGVPVQPLLAWARRDNLFGTVELEADLEAEGDNLRALARTLRGHAAAVMVEGDIDARLLLDPLQGVMNVARLPANLSTPRGVLSRLRCFAVRLEIEDGKARVATLAADAARFQLTGSGEVDLGGEAWALRLEPEMRAGASTLKIPVRMEGTLKAARLRLEREEAPPAGARELPEICAPALEIARAGRSGPMPAGRDARPALVQPLPRRPGP
jgi:AsmA protein